MKVGQVIEYKMTNIFFLKNHTQHVVEKLYGSLFQNIEIEHISGLTL